MAKPLSKREAEYLNAGLPEIPTSADACARRLTAFLSKSPRSVKTRAYLDTLPKRDRITVSPDEFVRESLAPAEPEKPKRKKAAAKVSEPVKPRRDRLRPRAIARPLPSLFQPAEIVTYADLIEAAVRKAGAVPYRRVSPTPGAYAAREQAKGDLLLRQRLYDLQEGLCGICRGLMGGPRVSNIDHVVPRALGGRNEGNRVLAHTACNTEKADRPPTEDELAFLAIVNARLANAASAEIQRLGGLNG